MKKMINKMNLMKNEKILLVLLSIIIIFGGIYKFIIIPQSFELENLTKESYEYKEKISQMNNVLKGKEKVIKELDDLHNEKSLIGRKYFSSLDQSEIIYFLKDIFDNQEIEIFDINFNRPSEEGINNLLLKTMEVSIPYRASYEGILEVIKNVALSPKKIIMIDITIDKDEDLLVGDMLLKIYSIDELANPEELFIVPPEKNKKEPPFEPYSTYPGEAIDMGFKRK